MAAASSLLPGEGKPDVVAIEPRSKIELDPDRLLTRGAAAVMLTISAAPAPEGKQLNSRHVHVVDDDRDVRCSISFMLGAAGIQSRPFGSGADFIESLDELGDGCVLLDIRMPETDGFQVMTALSERQIAWPVIAMTGHGEVPVAVRAMKLGAIDFLEKPFEEEVLLGSLDRAFGLLKERGEQAGRRRQANGRIETLSARELEVLKGLMAGLPNKELARRLEISLRTVEMHRANMMDRLSVGSLAEALTLGVQAGLEPLAA